MKSSQLEEIGSKYMHIFKPLIRSAIDKATIERNNEDGIFLAEILKYEKEQFDALARKGIPNVMGDYTITSMIWNDELYFNKDFSMLSNIPLAGYRKWSDLFE